MRSLFILKIKLFFTWAVDLVWEKLELMFIPFPYASQKILISILILNIQNDGTFYRTTVIYAQCFIGRGKIEKYRVAGMNCNYAIHKSSEAYKQTVSCFRHLAEDTVIQLYIAKKPKKTL